MEEKSLIKLAETLDLSRLEDECIILEDEKADEAQEPLRLTEDERRLVLLYRSLERPGGAAGPRFPQTKKSPGCGKKRTLTRMDDEEELR